MKKIILVFGSVIISLILSVSGFAKDKTKYVTSADSVKIAYDVQGKGEPTIVFVHGWSNTRAVWDAQVAHFSKDHRVVTIDLPGFGESGNNRTNWTIEAYGTDVATVVDKLNCNKVVLVGFSMGAPVVVEAARHLQNSVIGIVLVDQMQDIEFKAPLTLIADVTTAFFDILNHPTLENTTPFFKRNREASFNRAVAMFKDAPRKGWRPVLRQTFEWLNENAIEAVKNTKAPFVSINSDNQPTNVEGFKKLSPTYQAHIIPNTGHLVMWDAPDEFNRILAESIQSFVEMDNKRHEN